MNFFNRLHEFLTDQFDLCMVIRKNGDNLMVSIIPKQIETNPSAKLVSPFLIVGDTEQIGNDIIEGLYKLKEGDSHYFDNAGIFKLSLNED